MKFEKTIGSKVNFGLDWTLWLGNRSIVSSEWTLLTSSSNDPLSIVSGTSAHDGKKTFFWAEGGKRNTTYTLVNRIVTDDNLEDSRKITIQIVDR